MQKIAALIKQEAIQLLTEQSVSAVLAWSNGGAAYEGVPTVFHTVQECENIIYDEFCGANLSKLAFKQLKFETKIAVFLRPCDTYSMRELIKEHRVDREKVIIYGIPCSGMVDVRMLKLRGIKGITDITAIDDKLEVTTMYGSKTIDKQDVLLAKCMACKGPEYMLADKTLGEPMVVKHPPFNPLQALEKIEALPVKERFAFWQQELSKCIRCNACKDVCPACTCEQCIFDNKKEPFATKANATSAEEQVYHIIRAYHVAGRCTGCGECERVCPQGIKLGLLNLHFMRDINELYGPYQAGDKSDAPSPLLTYQFNDVESTVLEQRRESHAKD